MPKKNSKKKIEEKKERDETRIAEEKKFHHFCFTELQKYLKQLGCEINAIKDQIMTGLYSVEERSFSAWIVNDNQFELSDLAKATRLLLKEQPSHVLIDHFWLYQEGTAWATFKHIEEYLEKMPGAKLPEKTLAVSEWLEKMEKQFKGEKK